MGSQFVITNPNAQSTCGCGSSFSAWTQTIIQCIQKMTGTTPQKILIVQHESSRICSWKEKKKT
jgi:hypothetical protein